MSHYSEYIFEREGINTKENQYGFITYKIQDNKCLIVDMYIDKRFRLIGNGVSMMDELVSELKNLGVETIYCTCIPSTFNSTDSLRAILSYNFILTNSENDKIIFEKRI